MSDETRKPADCNEVQKPLGLDNDLFRKRMVELRKYILPEDKSVIDFVAGSENLTNLLDKDIAYNPVDYIKRSERTIVCYINKNEFPDINADVAFMAGFMEYCENPKLVLGQTAKHVKKIIISYKGRERFLYSQLHSSEIIDCLRNIIGGNFF